VRYIANYLLRSPAHLAHSAQRIAWVWNGIGGWAGEMKSDRRKWRTSVDGPDCEAACPIFVHLYILVVNKSLSVEVPYNGRF